MSFHKSPGLRRDFFIFTLLLFCFSFYFHRMDNETIAHNFSLLAKLMDIHGENSFKTKSYANAAFAIDKLPVELNNLPEEKIRSIKGIGDAIAQKIMVQLPTGILPLLNEYIEKTPPGIIEMLNIKGLGAKKIAVIWKELDVENIGELLYACTENRLMLYKGFGEKTQQNIKESIEFYLRSKGNHLYAEIHEYAAQLESLLQAAFPGERISLTGSLRKHTEIIEKIELVSTADKNAMDALLQQHGFVTTEPSKENPLYKSPEQAMVQIHTTGKNEFFTTLLATSSSPEFKREWDQQFPAKQPFDSEEAIFSAAGIAYIPPFLRERPGMIELAKQHQLPAVVQLEDITAIIHSHSKWSDGNHSIFEMAKGAIEKGFQYLVLSDHSKSAFYANGLTEERLRAQHAEIDELNKKLAPFRIFKSIESDILNDGSLDYADEVLATFDVVIASIHSNLKMTEDKAMKRLLTAIENPYTNILGHMTGRLLLSRSGYPVDHKTIIDACAANNVVIELNANPHRLDIDWRYLDYALERGVLTSINPDAHSINGYNDIRYGVLVAQKAGVTKEQNLSSFNLAQFEAFLLTQHAKR